jgi:hypothetical protein
LTVPNSSTWTVVDDQLGRLQRVDLLRVAAEGLHGVAHGGEVDDGRHAGEVLHQYAGGHVGDLARGLGGGVPLRQEADVVGGDGAPVLVAQQVFEQDAERKRQLAEVVFAERAEREVGDARVTGVEGGFRTEGVGVLSDVHR